MDIYLSISMKKLCPWNHTGRKNASQSSCPKIEKIQNDVTTFNDNSSTTIISYYSSTNVNDDTNLIIFYNEQSSFVRSILKHNVQIIGWDMNSQSGKDENNKFSLHNSSSRNGEHLTDFLIENELTCLNTKFQKRKKKLWIYTNASNAKAQIDYNLIN